MSSLLCAVGYCFIFRGSAVRLYTDIQPLFYFILLVYLYHTIVKESKVIVNPIEFEILLVISMLGPLS